MKQENNLSRLVNLEAPDGERRVLMHSCCAPCSGELMERMLENNIELTIFFYNPNIHPRKEYELRKQENIRFAEKLNIPFIDSDYDSPRWFEKARGMENEPERGIRCSMCFDMRFVKTAEYAKENGFKVITSSLGLSRWKDMEQINNSGVKAAALFDGITYWTYNWRKQGGSQRMYEIAKREEFYKQEYCGCVYSLRDTNQWRKETGRTEIALGEEFYGE
jgi:predicted adenine nucleotide alpha hydrolase (AANH) superfamily ATPase